MSIEAAIGHEGGAAPLERPVRVRRALISVSDKTGVVDFARGLRELGVEILSTGGTAKAIRDAGIEVLDVAEFTGSPEILDGRVKTLHPRLHAALLARRDDPTHIATLEREGIEPIDLVCVNLYPFEQTVERAGVSEADAVEHIDIGGPTMIRAAAKNHRDVAVLVRPESYDAVLAELGDAAGAISAETRHWLANEAFAHIAAYDSAISRWFGLRYEVFPSHFTVSYDKVLDLTYGENPHQKAALYVETAAREHVLSGVGKLHGRELSFNNVLDLDSGRRLLDELGQPACVIVKHNNPCGAAIAESALEAYERAFACDPLSAFGGVLVFNRPIEPALAQRLSEQFIEVLLAPGFDPEALELLTHKETIRILEVDTSAYEPRERDIKRVRGGLLAQDADRITETRETMSVPTRAQPTDEQWDDLIFAWTVCRHVRSNAIVFAAGGATIGIGAGQMSRVDSVRIAIDKAHAAFGDERAQELLRGSAVASDAFFPFADGPDAAIRAGATTVIQPGGSRRDDEVVTACDASGVAMVFTGRRHFRH